MTLQDTSHRRHRELKLSEAFLLIDNLKLRMARQRVLEPLYAVNRGMRLRVLEQANLAALRNCQQMLGALYTSYIVIRHDGTSHIFLILHARIDGDDWHISRIGILQGWFDAFPIHRVDEDDFYTLSNKLTDFLPLAVNR